MLQPAVHALVAIRQTVLLQAGQCSGQTPIRSYSFRQRRHLLASGDAERASGASSSARGVSRPPSLAGGRSAPWASHFRHSKRQLQRCATGACDDSLRQPRESPMALVRHRQVDRLADMMRMGPAINQDLINVFYAASRDAVLRDTCQTKSRRPSRAARRCMPRICDGTRTRVATTSY